MDQVSLLRRFTLLHALRWLSTGLAAPVLVLLPHERGLTLGRIGAAFGLYNLVVIPRTPSHDEMASLTHRCPVGLSQPGRSPGAVGGCDSVSMGPAHATAVPSDDASRDRLGSTDHELHAVT